MISQPRPGAGFSLRADPANPAPQRLLIEAEGPGVLLFEDNARIIPPADPFEVTPDPLVFLSERIAEGWFAPARADAPPPALSIDEVLTDPDNARQSWQVTAQNLQPGLFRIIANLLVARGMHHVTIAADTGAEIDPTALPYPSLAGHTRFPLDYLPPDRAERERSVEIGLQAPPSDAELDQIYALLEVWTQLVLLGAYPRDEQSPRDAGLFPDLAILSEADVVFQGIEIAFASDEMAFVPLVTCLHTGVGRDLAIRRVTIR